MSAVVWNVNNNEYHGDTTKLGSTMLKTAAVSPSEYRARYIDRTMSNEQTPSMKLGSLVHCLVLEPQNFGSLYAIQPECIDRRTTKGKEDFAEFAASSIGKEIVTPDMHRHAKAMADAVLSEPIVAELMEDSVRERAMYWSEGEITCKLKTDIWTPRPSLDTDLILDLKTSDDPTPEEWAGGGQYAPIPKWRIDLSLYHYERGIYEYTNRHCSTGLIVVGSAEPHDVYVYDATEWLEIGAHWWNVAMNAVRSGMTTKSWRRPEQGEVIPLRPTRWSIPD